MASPLLVSVLICTRNRAPLLSEALESLRGSTAAIGWELVVVDNASTDHTRAVIERYSASFPVALRYVHEPRLGKSYALNTGLGIAAGDVILFGDDDQRFAPDWIERGCQPLRDEAGVQYTGGPVLPLLEGVAPSWLDLACAEMRGPLGLFDYGSERFVFEERQRIPGGGNMAIRTSLAAEIGGFREDLGRRGRSLLGQEQAEFFARSRAAGARGVYVPGMVVWHRVPPERLRRRYFLRWWYWKGVAHARWQATKRRGIPRFVFSEGARALLALVSARMRRQRPSVQLLPLLRLAYLAGYAAESRRPVAPPSVPAVTPIRSQARI